MDKRTEMQQKLDQSFLLLLLLEIHSNIYVLSNISKAAALFASGMLHSDRYFSFFCIVLRVAWLCICQFKVFLD